MAQAENGGPGILVELYILLVVTAILVGLRIYVRLRVTNCWDWDDSTIVMALLAQVAGAILLTMGVHAGVGQHIYSLPDPEQKARSILKYDTFFHITVPVATLLTKISISLYILRIHNTPLIRRVLVAMMTLMTLAAIVTILVPCLACIPLEALWDPTVEGHCIPLDNVYKVGYVHSAFTIVTDLCLSISPVVILWNVKIQRGRKILICFLMGLGLVATVSNALRTAFQPELTDEDWTFAIIPIVIVTVLEVAAGNIAACIPSIMPLFQRKNRRHSTGNAITSYSPRLGILKTSGYTIRQHSAACTKDGLSSSSSAGSMEMRTDSHFPSEKRECTVLDNQSFD